MEHVLNDTNCVKVARYLRQKVEAIAAHRSQFPIQPDLLPLAILLACLHSGKAKRTGPIVLLHRSMPPTGRCAGREEKCSAGAVHSTA